MERSATGAAGIIFPVFWNRLAIITHNTLATTERSNNMIARTGRYAVLLGVRQAK